MAKSPLEMSRKELANYIERKYRKWIRGQKRRREAVITAILTGSSIANAIIRAKVRPW